jgi:hypothetical protein
MAVMEYLSSVGVVTGGDYGEADQKTCLPYAVPPNGAVPPYKCPGTGSHGLHRIIQAPLSVYHSWFSISPISIQNILLSGV